MQGRRAKLGFDVDQDDGETGKVPEVKGEIGVVGGLNVGEVPVPVVGRGVGAEPFDGLGGLEFKEERIGVVVKRKTLVLEMESEALVGGRVKPGPRCGTGWGGGVDMGGGKGAIGLARPEGDGGDDDQDERTKEERELTATGGMGGGGIHGRVLACGVERWRAR